MIDLAGICFYEQLASTKPTLLIRLRRLHLLVVFRRSQMLKRSRWGRRASYVYTSKLGGEGWTGEGQTIQGHSYPNMTVVTRYRQDAPLISGLGWSTYALPVSPSSFESSRAIGLNYR